MAFVFLFKCANEETSLNFTPLLEQMACNLQARFYSVYKDNTTSFYLQASAEITLEFAQKLSEILPFSLDFSFLSLKEITEPLDENLFQTTSLSKPLFMNAKEHQDFLDKNASLYADTLGLIKNTAFKGDIIHSPKELIDCLTQLKGMLKTQDFIPIFTSRGALSLSLKNPSPSVIFSDLSSVLSCTKLPLEDAKYLASLEKPSIKAPLKSVFKDTFKNDEIIAQLPYDPILNLLCHILQDEGIEFVFMHESRSYEVLLHYEALFKTPKRLITPAKKFVLENHLSTFPFKDELEFLNATPNSIVLYFSFKRPTRLLLHANGSLKTLLSVSFDFNQSFNLLKQDEKASRMLQNYEAKFPNFYARLLELSKYNLGGANVLDFFQILGFVLGYSEDFCTQSVISLAKECLRPKGPRIDYKILKDDSLKMALNFSKIMHSAMSFRLAGVENEILSLGILDSLAEFLGNFIWDNAQNFSVQEVTIAGDFFGEKVFLDLFVQYFPKTLTLKTHAFLDYE
ncbi:hydrogenase biosynthesis protein HydE [Helicobacter pylori]|uniref:hydrogenase biosynthesis protein HydE n=1 Tax=Helicobacter pylori TaxID=210 RepID=UPI001933CF6C|nr:hydrogenase biosynthesis protein HydE [Helicobacter pylori]MBM0611457.1 hydrogenase biosynthesis protein HydE [Helicobacter pylori]MBM0627856.1 hydrogenase biosynthesis protein HydE [Helicobacter pylori]